MGAWGEKAFENDSALDWLSELEAGGVEVLRDTLSTVADTDDDDYLDVEDGSAAIAAAEIVAAALGRGRDRLTRPVLAWLDENAAGVTPEDLVLARRAVERVLGRQSEVRGLWEEDGVDPAWRDNMRTLVQRLGGNPDMVGASGARREPGEGDITRNKQVLLTFLLGRGLEATDEQMERIQASRDPAEVRRWLGRALVASSVAEVLDGGEDWT